MYYLLIEQCIVVRKTFLSTKLLNTLLVEGFDCYLREDTAIMNLGLNIDRGYT